MESNYFFNLIQGSNPNKPPLIISYIKEFINQYFEKIDSKKPDLFEKAEIRFKEINLEDAYIRLIKRVTTTLKKDVSWRFLIIEGKNTNIYKYNKDDDYLEIASTLLQYFKDNEQDLYDLINYRWGLILESFNSSPRINKKVKIIDERKIKRNSLTKFKKYLDLENEEHKCFICDNEISDDNISIDHVIPWSYMYSDDIWNLVYVCKNCNSIKNNHIPSKDDIEKLKNRNEILLKYMDDNGIHNKIYDELKLALDNDYVNKFWIGSRN